jgi:hypothetical protein
MQSATTDTEYTANSPSAKEQASNSAHTEKSKPQFVSLTQDESIFLNKTRSSWKLANPKSVYTFRTQPIGVMQHLMHIGLFLMCSLLFILFYYLPFDNEVIMGVGDFSATTPIERIVRMLLVGSVLFNLHALKKSLHAYPIKRYWVAMASNALLQLVILNIYFCLLFILCVAFIGGAQGMDLFTAIELFNNEPSYEYYLVFDSFVSLGFVWYAFRFCRKGLK